MFELNTIIISAVSQLFIIISCVGRAFDIGKLTVPGSNHWCSVEFCHWMWIHVWWESFVCCVIYFYIQYNALTLLLLIHSEELVNGKLRLYLESLMVFLHLLTPFVFLCDIEKKSKWKKTQSGRQIMMSCPFFRNRAPTLKTSSWWSCIYH